MKLQINDSGSWRHVVTVDQRHTADLKLAANNIGLMAHMAGTRLTMRLLDDSDDVEAYWNAESGWCRHVARPGSAARATEPHGAHS